MAKPKPLALIILDGFGCRDKAEGNAVKAARKPNFDRYHQSFSTTTLGASGESVGLPDGQMGNSEVGHLNLGAGRIVYQDLTRITKSIRDGDFYTNPVFLEAANYVKKNGSKLHLYGLLSDGGVHSHLSHFFAMLEFAKQQGVSQVFVHAFLDGRDVQPYSARNYIKELQDKMQELGVGQLASVHGRYYAMDRDRRWERTGKAYRAMVNGEGEHFQDALSGLEASFDRGVTDEFVVPFVVVDEHDKPLGVIEGQDAVIVLNFRPDRVIQISQALTDSSFDGFDRGANEPYPFYVCMTFYSEKVKGHVAYPPTRLSNTMGEVLEKLGMKQLRIAETEKFPHVTSFFSGGREATFVGEERILIPSPKVATYDLQPEMSAYEVADAAVNRIKQGDLDVMILNFANPDMVGHTGVMEAAVKAIETVDECLGRVVDTLLEVGGAAIIIADHGNSEVMIDEATGQPATTHTTNPVPCIVTVPGLTLRKDGILADMSPTMLDLLGIEQPSEMTGQSIIVEREGM